MLDKQDLQTDPRFLISRVAHVVGRIGLAMSGAMCGTFVAAYLERASIAIFGSIGFIMSMILIGIIGFYLGIDIPQLRASHGGRAINRRASRADPVEWLSAIGTFLAAVAALASVYAIVLDEVPQRPWEFLIGCWWLLGAIMQIGAGSLGRLRLADRAAG
jgi:hypothetical protein